MFWADRAALELKGKGPQLVDDMKTPSGRIHVGALRGVIIHDLVFRTLKDAGVKARYTYIFDDHDPMTGVPLYLPKRYQKYLGFPLNKVPSPEKGFANYAQYWASEFREVFQKLGARPEIIWSSKLYEKGMMDEGIKSCLDNADKIRRIYKRISGSERPKDWFPFFVICTKCGRISTTVVNDWDGKTVGFKCEPAAFKKYQGCGHQGRVSPFGGTGKLPWKIEWAVKWQVLGVTVEGEGKDHATAGGAREIADVVSKQVLGYQPPYDIPYEFLLYGGEKMATRRGIGVSAKDAAQILPPELLRFLMVRTHFRKTIDFDPVGWTIPDLFDEYDRTAQVYWEKGAKDDLGRVFELSQPDGKPPKKMFLPRFRDVAMVVQMPNVSPQKYFAGQKGRALTSLEKKVLDQRVGYAKIWLDGYAPQEAVFSFAEKLPRQTKRLSGVQKEYLAKLSTLVGKTKTAKQLEEKMYDLLQELGLSPQKAFTAVYTVLLGKPHGPKAAWLILSLGADKVKKRFEKAAK